MSFLTLLLVSVGLAADAFAVSIGKGLQLRRLRPGVVLAIALTFGVFQAAMPVIGYLLGSGLSDTVSEFDHWIAFGLLAAIGGKMIWEALTGDDEDEPEEDAVPVRELLLLGLATSIDALAAGVGLAFLDVDIVLAAVLIGVVTFGLSVVGVVLGHRAGKALRGPAEIVGGVVLIAIGTRVLLTHLGVW